MKTSMSVFGKQNHLKDDSYKAFHLKLNRNFYVVLIFLSQILRLLFSVYNLDSSWYSLNLRYWFWCRFHKAPAHGQNSNNKPQPHLGMQPDRFYASCMCTTTSCGYCCICCVFIIVGFNSLEPNWPVCTVSSRTLQFQKKKTKKRIVCSLMTLTYGWMKKMTTDCFVGCYISEQSCLRGSDLLVSPKLSEHVHCFLYKHTSVQCFGAEFSCRYKNPDCKYVSDIAVKSLN